MANIVTLLDRRIQGLDPQWLLPQVYGTQKWTEITLSKNTGFEGFHTRSIMAIDLEQSTNQFLISGNSEGSIAIHDMNTLNDKHNFSLVTSITGSSMPSAHSHGISTIQWYPLDTGIFTTSSMDKTLRVWDTNEMCVVEQFSFPGPVYSHCITHSEKLALIAVGCHGSNDVTLCDIQSGLNTHILRRHKQPVTCLKWSPCDPHLLASGSQDNKVFLWDVRKATGPLRTLDQHNGGGASSTASVITAHNGFVTSMCFTDDGLFLVTMGTDQRARLWDVITGVNMLVNYGRIIQDKHHILHSLTLTPSPLSHKPHLLVTTKCDIAMFELFTGKVVKKLKGHYGAVAECIANRERFEIYSGGAEGKLLLWQPESKENLVGRKNESNASSMRVYSDAWSDDEN